MCNENETECDKPELLKQHGGKCPEEQILKCHGREMLERMKNSRSC